MCLCVFVSCLACAIQHNSVILMPQVQDLRGQGSSRREKLFSMHGSFCSEAADLDCGSARSQSFACIKHCLRVQNFSVCMADFVLRHLIPDRD